MSTTVSLEHCTIQVTKYQLGLTRDRYTRQVLGKLLHSKLSWKPAGNHVPSRPLQDLVSDFSESIATGSITDITEYFRRLSVSGLTAGGRPAASIPLLYTKRKLRPSRTSIGALGEGIAGDYLENFEKMQFEVRPFEVSPDMIFKNAQRHRVLVEVKTSLDRFQPIPYALDLLDILAKTKFIRAGRYLAYVIGVIIRGPANFELRRLCIEEI